MRQLDEIEKLKSSISELEIDSEKRTELIDSITDIPQVHIWTGHEAVPVYTYQPGNSNA